MKEVMDENGKTRVGVVYVQEIRWHGQGRIENIVKWMKGQRISWLRHIERMEEDRMHQKDLHPRTGRDEKKGKTQEKM